MQDTCEKYKKGYTISQNATEYEGENPQDVQKLRDISNKAKQRKDFEWLNEIPTVEEVETKVTVEYKGEER